ncbi:MAG TPA: alpha/beta hydrolase [archaeon]|nr:alpha/beta hydrolase [archaeon]
MKFVIFHGAYGNPEKNWFPELKERLEMFGQEVIAPKFPVEDWNEVSKAGHDFNPRNQTLESWMKVFDKVKSDFKKGEKLCFIGHSMSPVFILRVVEKYDLKLDSAIFVSPFLGPLGNPRFDVVNKSFYKTDFDFEKLRKLVPVSYVLYSENDPYVHEKNSKEFAEKMHSSVIFVRKAGHMNSEVNLNEFPLVLELCKSRLDLSLYQKYLAHRRELYSVPYINGKGEEIIFLDPKEVFEEGVFHFRNLRQEGFCTFLTSLKFWDTQSKYMEEARKAAMRIKLIRVFIIDKISDLKRSNILKQIILDMEAGINVYFCILSQIEGKTGEIDFGIWDNDYLCAVHYDKRGGINEVKLTSRAKDIEEALKWKNIILKKAVRIKSEKDIKIFVEDFHP